jgi:uncharacterized protein YukE
MSRAKPTSLRWSRGQVADSAALQGLAGSLRALAGRYGELASRLDALIYRVVDSGWQGEAADRFLAVSSAAARQVGSLASPIGEIVGATMAYGDACAHAEGLRARAREMESQAFAEANDAYRMLAMEYPTGMLVHDPLMASARAAAESSVTEHLHERLAEVARLDMEAELCQRDAETAYRARASQASDGLRGLEQQVLGVLGDLFNGASVVSVGLATRALARAARLPGELDQLAEETIGGYAAELEGQVAAGEISQAQAEFELSRRVKNFELAREAFQSQQAEDTARGGVDALGPAAGPVGDALGWLGVAGDIFGIIDPPQRHGAWSVIDRSAAAVNGLDVAAFTFAPGLLGLDAATGWIPVAGQVIVVATSAYLVGATLYATWRPFRRVVNDVGRGIEHVASAVGHATAELAHDEVQAVADVATGAAQVVSDLGSLL